jgi:hypothetical protein
MPGRGRLVERSFVLTLLTFVLLTPPIIAIFNVPVLVLGVPLLHVYCFGVWLAAIVVGARLAAGLRRDDGATPQPEDAARTEPGGRER